MEAPPPVPPGLLGFSLALGAAGALLAVPAGAAFLILYGLAAGWTAAYSHPATRWKAGPVSSALAIGLGQGCVGFAAGWAAAAPLQLADPLLLAGAAGAAFTAVGLYPATQVFQVEEDRARGDRTLAVALGPARALRLGALLLLAGGALAAWAADRRFDATHAAAVSLGYLLLVAWQLRLAATVAEPGLYRRAMRLVNAGTACFLLFLLVSAL
jgi:1,4-dihydroxy-2-naphthoate octaprenyltransferase